MKWIWICLISLYGFASESSFLEMAGKETARWRYMKTERDWKDLAYFQEVFEKGIEKLRQDGKVKIPRVVHFIWIGPKNFPIESIQNVRTWMSHHPDWTFKFWTDRERPAPCAGMEVHQLKDFKFKYLAEEFSQSLNWGQKSDLWRYEILLKEGGVYVDHDANCLQSFEPFHRSYRFYGCLEVPHWSIDGYHVTAGNGLFGAVPNHPVVKGSIDAVKKNWKRIYDKYQGRDQKIVMNTGYVAFTHSLHENLGDEDVVFPASYFFSTDGLPSLYSHHFYWNSWDDQFEVITPHQKGVDKAMVQLRKTNLQTIYLLLAGIVSLMGSGLFLWRAKR